jgi:hypothetical protein
MNKLERLQKENDELRAFLSRFLNWHEDEEGADGEPIDLRDLVREAEKLEAALDV